MNHIEQDKKLLQNSQSIHLGVAFSLSLLTFILYQHFSIFQAFGLFVASSIIISIFSPLKYRIRKKWSNFFNSSQIISSFKEGEYLEEDSQVEDLSKKILFQLYCKKHNLKAKEYSFYNKNYSQQELELDKLISRLNDLIQIYPQTAEKVYQPVYDLFFKKDALLSYAMTHQEKNFIQFLIQNNLLKFSQEDLLYLNYGNNIHKSVATLLFKPEVYETLPKEVRSYLLTHISKKSKEIFEKEALLLEKNIVQNEKKQLDKVSENIFQPLFEKSQVIMPHVSSHIKNLLTNTYEALKFLQINFNYLSVEEQLEFKNIYEKILPTYLDLFISKNFELNHEFEQGILLIEETLNNYKNTILNNHTDEFKTYHQYVVNKLDKNMSIGA